MIITMTTMMIMIKLFLKTQIIILLKTFPNNFDDINNNDNDENVPNDFDADYDNDDDEDYYYDDNDNDFLG